MARSSFRLSQCICKATSARPERSSQKTARLPGLRWDPKSGAKVSAAQAPSESTGGAGGAQFQALGLPAAPQPVAASPASPGHSLRP